ncbi:MAG: alpha/beta hydrolase [Verrucomicrobiota bacterium]
MNFTRPWKVLFTFVIKTVTETHHPLRVSRAALAVAAGLQAAGAVDPMAGAPYAVPYPDHTRLMEVRDASGVARPVTSPADWAERASHIRAGLQQAMGPLPGAAARVPLEVEELGETSSGKYLRRKVRFTAEHGDRVPAWLLIPHSLSHRAPAMLCLHQTTDIGKDEPAGLGGRPSLHYAHELAERGYVCVVPDYPSFGEYPYDFRKQGAHHASGSIKAVWNNLRAVDLLESLPQVDATRIGVIGHSLGGHNALFTAVFDPRLKAVVTSCGFTPFHDYYGGKVAGWTSDRYMPRIRTVYGNEAGRIPFDFPEVLGVIAPRGVFSNSPVRDDNFEVAGVRRAFEAAARVFALHVPPGASNDWVSSRLVLRTPDSGHDFPEAERQAAYSWLDSVLR